MNDLSLNICGKCRGRGYLPKASDDPHPFLRSPLSTCAGIPDFQAPPPIPKFIDAIEAIDELPEYDSFEPANDDF
jgi:hypothetical protein